MTAKGVRWRWAKCCYTLGLTYFESWDFNPHTHAPIRCLEFGFFWFECCWFWEAPTPAAAKVT